MSKKILVYGGSFDPPHIGHMWLLLQAMEFIKPDEVQVVPAWSSPLKNGHVASYDDRREMLRLTLADFLTSRRHALVWISDFEARRGRRTYSYELVEDIYDQTPPNDVYFLAGSDCLKHLHEWRSLRRFSDSCTLVIGIRPGSMVGVPADYKGHMVFLPAPTEGESSTEVRRLLGMDLPVNGIITPSVLGHITRKKLYATKARV